MSTEKRSSAVSPEEDERVTAFGNYSEVSFELRRVKALLVLMADYEVGYHGHDGTTYLGLGAAIRITNEILEKLTGAMSEAVDRQHGRKASGAKHV